MTEHDPPRMRELELRDSELSNLLDAAGRDVAPPEVLSRSAQRLSAAIGISLGDAGGLGSPPIDSVAASAKSGAVASATKGAATVAAAKSAGAIAPMLAAVAKPLLVVALASATSVAVWSAQPARPAAPAAPAAPIAAPKVIEPSVAPAVSVSPSAAALPAQLTPQELTQLLQANEEKRAREPIARTSRASSVQATPVVTAAAAPIEVDEELRSLQAAQAELATRPSDAVLRLRAHEKLWPNGWLDEERAALLVEALLRAGQRAEAEHALAELRTRRPRSPALPRLARMFEHAGE